MIEHTHKQFDAEMEALRKGVLEMGGLVEAQLARAIGVLSDGDEEPPIALIGAVEQRINEMQIAIDQQCAQIIARRQPAAFDLRTILIVTKIINELERVGDHAKNIAESVVQVVRGKDVRHASAEQIRAEVADE